MKTTHENSRFRSQLLEKTIVLNPSLLARLKSQFLPSATATVATFATVEPSKHSHTKIGTTVLLVALLATCTSPSYANNVKVQQRVNEKNTKFSLRLNSKSEESSQLEKINQLSFFDSFNCVDKVAVTGNNLKQERQNLFKSVQHHTIVDVFLCLSFANCLFTGELRLALALVRLWWGGDGNKPFIRRIPSAVVTAVLNLPAALYLGLITQTSLPVRKVL